MADQASELPIKPIPQVPKHWFTGNLPDIDPSFLAKSLWRLTDLYGPIFRLDLGGADMIVISNYEFLKEVQQDDRFEKQISAALVEMRPLLKDALFSAHPWEEVSSHSDLRSN